MESIFISAVGVFESSTVVCFSLSSNGTTVDVDLAALFRAAIASSHTWEAWFLFGWSKLLSKVCFKSSSTAMTATLSWIRLISSC
jgi:hypothetical protein